MRRLPLRSPPRVRGKVAMEHFSIAICGITPAYAGKSAPFLFTVPRGLDHPRVCGEKRFSRYWVVSPKGSPPHMRGKDSSGSEIFPVFGITPAYAGKSMGALIADAAERDHPRMCGEKTSASSLFNTAAGSPPRVRGKELRVETCFSHDGITPAYAGKRVSRSRAKTGEWDHPRVCGEKTVIHKNDRIAQGSPPRVRGKVLGTGKGCDGVGITPACAGKRMVFAGRKSRTWDHPRVCGEKLCFSSWMVSG